MASMDKYAVLGPAGPLECVQQMPSGAPRALAVVAHPLPVMGGTMENKVVTTLNRSFVELGCVSLRFNFRGVGDSAGAYDEGNGETEDMLAVIAHAKNEHPQLPLILSGFSFGGYVAARAAERLSEPAVKLVLAAPAVGRFAMPDVPEHTLVIHGEKDEVVALQDMLDWARPQRLPVVVLPDAEHYFHGRLVQLREIVRHHFQGWPL